MKILKTIMLIIIITIISICAFGGGSLIWFLIALLIKPSPLVFGIWLYIFTFVPMPFCWWVASKIGEKYF